MGRLTAGKRKIMLTTLNRLQAGMSGVVTKVGGEGALRLHFLDMGIIPGTKINVYKIAPLGDPMEVHLRGYSLTLRKEDAANIEINRTEEEDNSSN